MKRIVFILCITTSPIFLKAQIKISIDYDMVNRTITLILKNETDNIYTFVPEEMGLMKYNYVSSITFIYKDINGNTLCKRNRFIFDDQHPVPRNRYLAPYCENKYIHNLTKWCNDESIYAVDIFIKIDCRTLVKDNMSKKIIYPETYQTELNRHILW